MYELVKRTMIGRHWLYIAFSLVSISCLIYFSAVAPAPLKMLHNISLPLDAQIEASIFARKKKTNELRIAFMSNCFFHGTVMNGARHAVLPDSLTMVREFERWLRGQEKFREREISVFNASFDGTSILDHLALSYKLSEYKIDAIALAASYTEFRELPMHPLLGNLKQYLSHTKVDQNEVDDLSKSRGRLISMDFQRWLTAKKYEFIKSSSVFMRLVLWNREVREQWDPTKDETHYATLYGGEVIPIQHIGLKAEVGQGYRKYLSTLAELSLRKDIHLILINQPIRFKDTIESVNPGLFVQHEQLLRQTAKKYTNSSFINLDAMIKAEHCLSDYIHLTYDGKRAVSALLNPALAEILSTLL